MTKLLKKETTEEIELVTGERILYYPYIDLPPETPGIGRAIGELENGERIIQYKGITREEAEHFSTVH